MRKNIGFVGLGKMGSVMAPLFIEAGFKLTVFNRSPEKTEAVRRMGAMVAETPAEVSENSDLVFTMLSCLLYTSPSPRDQRGSRMPSSA